MSLFYYLFIILTDFNINHTFVEWNETNYGCLKTTSCIASSELTLLTRTRHSPERIDIHININNHQKVHPRKHHTSINTCIHV